MCARACASERFANNESYRRGRHVAMSLRQTDSPSPSGWPARNADINLKTPSLRLGQRL